jgi:hypothetical protein
VEYQKIATGRLGSVRSENEAFSISEAIKIIETIFNNRLRKNAVKREFFPSPCLQHRSDLKDFGFKLQQKQAINAAQSDGLGVLLWITRR